MLALVFLAAPQPLMYFRLFTHWGLVTYIRQRTGSSLVQVMGCRQIGTEPMFTSCQWDSFEQTLEKLESRCTSFIEKKAFKNVVYKMFHFTLAAMFWMNLLVYFDFLNEYDKPKHGFFVECIFNAKYIQLLNAVKRVLSYISFEVLMSHEGTMCGWFIDILHCHCSDVIMSAIASPMPASRLFTQPFIQGADKKKTSKLRVTGLCEGNSPVTGELPAQGASNAENVSIWWRHHGCFNTARYLIVPASGVVPKDVGKFDRNLVPVSI